MEHVRVQAPEIIPPLRHSDVIRENEIVVPPCLFGAVSFWRFRMFLPVSPI